ncbi:GNAT family N-acetyltransferase [Roseococcus sp. DSY-14]|uniref:GNAT family N-acetyltransferase n=1 Tax=Roseococcus sp. DSY-14 TaxID=3369650 RepID=UPI00387A8A49
MIRPVTDADIPALAALNDAEAEHVNALGESGLRALLGAAWLALRAEGALLVALRGDTPSQGPNHAWFQARLPAFAYVDRVVVAPAARGRGLARALYAEVEARARAAGLPLLCCEVNLLPPNPASLAFHAALGFAPMGEATDPRNGKVVRYLCKPLG